MSSNFSMSQWAQTGTLPNNILDAYALTTDAGMLDLRLNYMSCCGVGPLIHDPGWTNYR